MKTTIDKDKFILRPHYYNVKAFMFKIWFEIENDRNNFTEQFPST